MDITTSKDSSSSVVAFDTAFKNLAILWLIIVSVLVSHRWLFTDAGWLHNELVTPPEYIWTPPRDASLLAKLRTLFDWSVFDSSSYRLRLLSDLLEVIDAITRPATIWLFGLHPSLTLSALVLAVLTAILFYKALRHFGLSTAEAALLTAAFLTTIGYLSCFMPYIRPAKKVAVFCMCLSLYFIFRYMRFGGTRNSAIWETFPVFLVTGILWVKQFRDRTRWPVFWPAGLALLAGSALPAHNALLVNPHYPDPQMATGHIFWYQVVSLHNNPNLAKYGIPSTVQPWEDTVAQIVFAQEIAKRGQTRADFEKKDADRKLLNGIDLDWGAYERVLRDVLLRTIRNDPLYTLQSFLIYKPLAIVKSLFSAVLFDWGRILDWRVLIAVVIGALAAAPTMWQCSGAGVVTLGATLLASLTPVFLVAPSTNRVLEVYVVLLACGLVIAVTLLGTIWPTRLSRSV